MLWFKRTRGGIEKIKKRDLPDGLWVKCESCGEILYKKQLERTLHVCPKCNFHFRIDSCNYIKFLLDDGHLDVLDDNLLSSNPLSFPKYTEKLEKSHGNATLKEGVTFGRATIGGFKVIFAITDFNFIGGSMGSVVGEQIARAIRLSRKERNPLIILTASGGGARMQEGMYSLMQMVKTSSELALLAKERVPYIAILTHPTMAGVMASFASLGDIIIAEPNALLGFTGPRVIEQTIGKKLPPGFQRSEFLLEHGMVDMVVSRKDMKNTLIRILSMLSRT